MSATRPVRVLVVDDDTRFVEALSALLSTDGQVEVVGTAANGEEGVLRATWLRPDIVTMDLEMPRMDGVEATRQIRAQLPRTRVIVVSSSDYADRAEAARAAGAATTRAGRACARASSAAGAGSAACRASGASPRAPRPQPVTALRWCVSVTPLDVRSIATTSTRGWRTPCCSSARAARISRSRFARTIVADAPP